MALKVRTMKLDDATWERWQAEAKAAGISVAALIAKRMEAGPTVAKAKVKALEADIVAIDKSVARVTKLTGERDAARDDLAQALSDIERLRATCDVYLDKIKRADARIAGLEAGQSSSKLAAKHAVAALRSDPAMKAVVADGGELKPVASVLPVTGTEFPARPVYLRGQTPDKGKGKRS